MSSCGGSKLYTEETSDVSVHLCVCSVLNLSHLVVTCECKPVVEYT